MASNISQNGSLTTSNTNIKLRGNSGGVPLAHADVDGNFELLRLGHNDVVSDLAQKAASGHSHSNASTSASGFMSTADKSKLDGLSNYSLPTATSSVKGGVSVGGNISVTSAGLISVPTATNTVGGVIKLDGNTIKMNGTGQIYVDASNVDTDTNTTYSAGTGIAISASNVISATGGGGAGSTHASPSETFSIAESLAGYGTQGIMVANVPGTINVYLNDSTGTTDFTTKRSYVHTSTGAININEAFKNVATAEQYLHKFHNGSVLNLLYIFQTDITDTTLGGYSRPDESHIKGVQYFGESGITKWTIDDLGRSDIIQLRGRLVVDNMHFHVKANTAGSAGTLFGVFEGAHMLTLNSWAVELGTDVYIPGGIVGCYGGTFYGEHTRWEVKNNLTSINLCQPIFTMRGGRGYTGGQNVHSGQFHTARMLGNAEWIQYHSTIGSTGNDGNVYAGTNVTATPFTDDEAIGNWWQESSYNYPAGYVDLKYPAFRFEGIGNTVNWGGDDQVTNDVMRYSSVVGQTERFDIPQVGVGMANPTYSNASTASNAGIVFNWDSPTGPSTTQTNSIAFGGAAFYMNQIHYPWGSNGTDFTHTNYRGWAFPGVTPSLPTVAFTIIS